MSEPIFPQTGSYYSTEAFGRLIQGEHPWLSTEAAEAMADQIDFLDGQADGVVTVGEDIYADGFDFYDVLAEVAAPHVRLWQERTPLAQTLFSYLHDTRHPEGIRILPDDFVAEFQYNARLLGMELSENLARQMAGALTESDGTIAARTAPETTQLHLRRFFDGNFPSTDVERLAEAAAVALSPSSSLVPASRQQMKEQETLQKIQPLTADLTPEQIGLLLEFTDQTLLGLQTRMESHLYWNPAVEQTFSSSIISCQQIVEKTRRAFANNESTFYQRAVVGELTRALNQFIGLAQRFALEMPRQVQRHVSDGLAQLDRVIQSFRQGRVVSVAAQSLTVTGLMAGLRSVSQALGRAGQSASHPGVRLGVVIGGVLLAGAAACVAWASD